MIHLNRSVLLFVAYLFAWQTWAFEIAPNMPCGTYHVRGIVGFNGQGQPLLKIQSNTSSPYELLLIHPDLRQLMLYRGQDVSAEVFVPRPIVNNHKPFVVFRKWMPRKLPTDRAVHRVRLAKCHD